MIDINLLYKLFLAHPVVCTDTRKLTPNCLFFALKGGNYNGNTFAIQALEQGAAYAIIDEKPEVSDARLIQVEHVLNALQQLAAQHRKTLKIPVIGITGSNGKTTTKELVAAVLSKKYKTYFTQGNLNNHIGVPLTLLALGTQHEFAVVEMGANHQQEIADLCQIAQPDYGLITNIGKAHLEGFGGIEGVKKGKGELYDYLRKHNGLIFINSDQAFLTEILNGYSLTVSYGENLKASYRGRSSTKNEYLCVEIIAPFQLKINTQLTGEYNLPNILSAVAIGSHFGVSNADIQSALENYAPSNQRSQVIKKGKLTIVLDAYNANPSSLSAALLNFKTTFNEKKYLALGEMLELGDASIEEHMQIASLANSLNAEFVICVGTSFKEPAKKFNFIHFDTSEQAAVWLKENLPQQGAILIKGSRGSKMEKIMDVFKED